MFNSNQRTHIPVRMNRLPAVNLVEAQITNSTLI
jgi:hypothetical protein